MTREFSWNKNSKESLEEAAKAFEAAQALAQEKYWADREREDALNQAVEAQKADMGNRTPAIPVPQAGTPADAPSIAYQQAKEQQDMAIAQKVARLKELNERRSAKMSKLQSNPNFQMAAMLAMAGQPGALQALITQEATGGSSNKYQQSMDDLEKSMMNDIFALASADANTSAKIMEALLPYYKSKFDELSGHGAMSRLGGWDAWDKAIRGAKGRKAAAQAKKDALDAALEQASQNRRGRR